MHIARYSDVLAGCLAPDIGWCEYRAGAKSPHSKTHLQENLILLNNLILSGISSVSRRNVRVHMNTA